jgi:3',5'-cyclic AMP phosphodiesterase CpdA
METARTLAHVSDLHFGRDAATERACAGIVEALLEARVDDVLVTGDVTDRGRAAEWERFALAFAPLRERLLLVPGNHDRLGDDAAVRMMTGRVEVTNRRGLHVVRVDSTAPHNRGLLEGHGELTARDLDEIERAARAGGPGALVVVALHHHPLPLPPEGIGEWLSDLLGWPNAAELPAGRDLVARLRGVCDVVAHGHRHVESAVTLGGRSGRPLRVRNAGCTPDLGRIRLVTHAGGSVLSESWLDLAPARLPARAPVPAAA